MQEWRKIFESATGTATNGHCAAALERRIGGERQLGDVELLVVQHALERLRAGAESWMSRSMPSGLTRPSISGRVRS